MKGDQSPPSRGGAATTIAAERVAELLRLANRLHRTPRDPTERKNELLDGLVAMTAAERGACAVVHDDGGPAPVILSSGSREATDRKARRRRQQRDGSRRSRRDERDPQTQSMLDHLVAAVREAARGNGHVPATVSPGIITALVRLDQTRSTFGAIALLRSEHDRPFDGDDQSLVWLFHHEMAWVYELDLPLASPEVTSLPPRARETLQYLLAGFSEKQIAARLGLSHNTIHHYVKLLYRHFGVFSRSELLARWVRDPHAGTPPTSPAPPVGELYAPLRPR